MTTVTYNKGGKSKTRIGNWVEEAAIAEATESSSDDAKSGARRDAFAETATRIQYHQDPAKADWSTTQQRAFPSGRPGIGKPQAALLASTATDTHALSDKTLKRLEEVHTTPLPSRRAQREEDLYRLAQEKIKKDEEERKKREEVEALEAQYGHRDPINRKRDIEFGTPLEEQAARNPLHGHAVTLYTERLTTETRDHGMTPPVNPELPFGKNTTFSKPIAEYTEGPWKS